MLLIVFQTGTILAAEGTVTYGSSSYSPTEGQEFQVGVYVNGSEPIGAYEFYLDYNADMIEYVSGAESGGGGRLKFTGYGNASSYKYMLTFRAVKAGSSNITISNVYLGPLNPSSGDSMTITAAASAPINIQGPSSASEECRLADLKIAPTGLWGFASDKTEYDITVDNSINKLSITATPMSEKASVVISDTNLEVGVNNITIKVTAENGTVKNYNIIVRRKSAETQTQPPTTTSSLEEPVNLSISFLVNGKDMYITDKIDNITAPDGFQKTTITYKNQEIPAFIGQTQNITLFYLQDGLGENGNFYAYNSAKDNVYPYIRLTNADHSYMLVSPESNVEAPAGYQETTLALSNGGDENMATTIQAWVQGSSAEYFLIYALNEDGEYAFYQYDTKERTLQRFNASAAVKPSEPETTEPSAEDSSRIEELEAEVIKLKMDNQIDAKNKLMIIIVLAVFCVVLIIVAIGLILKLKGQTTGDYEEEELDEPELKEFPLVQQDKVEKSNKIGKNKKKQEEMPKGMERVFEEGISDEEVPYIVESAKEIAREAAVSKEEIPKPEDKIMVKARRPEPKTLMEEPRIETKPKAEVKPKIDPEQIKVDPVIEDDDDFLLDLDDDDDFTFFDYDDK